MGSQLARAECCPGTYGCGGENYALLRLRYARYVGSDGGRLQLQDRVRHRLDQCGRRGRLQEEVHCVSLRGSGLLC